MKREPPDTLPPSFESRWLHGVFIRALAAAVGSLGAAACSSEAAPCNAAPPPLSLAEIKPGVAVDYLALRISNTRGPQDAMSFHEEQHRGEPCSGASDVDACRMNLAALSLPPLETLGACGQTGCRYLATTKGDEAKLFATADEVRGLLAPIDSAEEARLLIEFRGLSTCADSPIERTSAGFETDAVRLVDSCPVRIERVEVLVRADGAVEQGEGRAAPEDKHAVCIGRRPEGLVAASSKRHVSTLAGHFAAVAQLEAASVAAFEVIALELAHHGAPATLIAQAHAAAHDEVHHAQAMARLAQRFGARPEAARVERRPLRSLGALALDNASEGCVRETFGALIGHHQAARAEDPEIAAAMRGVAEDETRHAALAHQIDAWVMPLLAADERARVEAARRAALVHLRAELEQAVDTTLQTLAGVPAAPSALRLFAALERELWSAASAALHA